MKLVWKLLMAAGVGALALSSCALSGGPISGQVLDETTDKPVMDAIVVVHWNGSWSKLGIESSSACYHVETARTDAEGRCQIPAWTTPWHPRDLFFSSNGQSYHVYRPGYMRGGNYAAAPRMLYMAPYKGSVAYYFETALNAPYWSCARAGASGKNEYRLFKAMAQEAQAMAESPQQRGSASMLRHLTEQSLVNFDKPTHLVGDRSENIDPRDGFKKGEVPL